MISSAIQSSLVMIPIILIVHLLLKHILIDKEIERVDKMPKQMDKGGEGERDKENLKEDYQESEDHDEDDDEDEEKKYLKRRLAKLSQQSKGPKPMENKDKIKHQSPPPHQSPNIKFQTRRPAKDPVSTRVTPDMDDVYSFVLQGEPSQKNENAVDSKPNSFFTDPHHPISPRSQSENRIESYMDKENNETQNKSKMNSADNMKDSNPMNDMSDMSDMNEMYSDPMFTKRGPIEGSLFNNIDAANSDGDETSLDEIFRQTQVPRSG